jgi:hypothetical protein
MGNSLQEVGRLLHTTGVVDGDDLHGRVGAAGLQAAHEVAANAAEAVDGHLQLSLGHLSAKDCPADQLQVASRRRDTTARARGENPRREVVRSVMMPL